MNRYAAIDLSRAFAVILVTVSHVSRGPWLPSFSIGNFDLFGFMQNGWIGVGIFFIISGYCMGITSERTFSHNINFKSYTSYILKRFLRIIPPYYFSIAVWVFIIRYYNIAPKPTGLFDVLTHLTFTHNLTKETFFSISGVYWSIAVEMQFYLLLPLLVLLCRSLSYSMIMLLVTLSLAVSINIFSTNVVYRWGLGNYLFLFLLGFLLHKYKEYLSLFVCKFKLRWFLVIAFVLLLSYKGSGYSNDQKIYEILSSSIFGFIMISGRNSLLEGSAIYLDFLNIIGRASFSIYLYNYMFYSVMPRGNNYFAMIFMVLGTLGFGVLMHLLIEDKSEKFRYYIFKKK